MKRIPYRTRTNFNIGGLVIIALFLWFIGILFLTKPSTVEHFLNRKSAIVNRK